MLKFIKYRDNKYYIENNSSKSIKGFNKEEVLELLNIGNIENVIRTDDEKVYGYYKVIVKFKGSQSRVICRCINCGDLTDKFLPDLKRNVGINCHKCSTKRHNINFIDMSGQTINNLEIMEFIGGKRGIWKCKCLDCGMEQEIDGYRLRSESNIRCNCTGKKYIDMVGKVINNWEVIKYAGRKKWVCKCLNCGNKYIVSGKDIRSNRSKYCGCTANKMIDLKNKTFGSWRVIEYTKDGKWLCRCKCGTEKEVGGYELRTYQSMSCGCETELRKRITMMERYGDIATSKINNNRTKEQIESVESKDNLIEFIMNNFGTEKPTSYNLGRSLGLSICTVDRYIKKYEMESYIDRYESSGEKEIYEFISRLIDEKHIEKRVRGVIGNNLELDIYIPIKKLAIEFNGIYWHSDLMKEKNYHQNKTLNCMKNGIRLIHIFEYEWRNDEKREKIKRIIKNLLVGYDRVIGARKTKVLTISKEECSRFLNDNHLQGNTNSSIRLGLSYKNELVQVMTFGAPRFNNSAEWEIIRLSSKSDTIVIGGTERLFKAFCKMYNPNTVISYCDISKFLGYTYERLGFECIKITEPNYVWADGINTFSRYETMKHKLIKDLGTEYESYTEDDIMRQLGYYKIYNCGNARYEWRNK